MPLSRRAAYIHGWLCTALPESQPAIESIHDFASQFDQLVAQNPQATFLVVADDPTESLAHWLDDGAAGEFEGIVEQWSNAVRGLLRHVHREPGRFILVPAIDVERDPEALIALLQSRFDLPSADASRDFAMPSGNELTRTLAEALLRRNGRVTRLHEELIASCVPLLEDDDDRPPETSLSAAAAIRALFDLRSSLTESTLSAQRANAEAHALRQEVLDAQQAAQAAGAETEQLQLQLFTAQEELELAVLARHTSDQNLQQSEAEARTLREAMLDAQQAATAANAMREQLQQQLLAAQEELKLASKVRDELERQLAGGQAGNRSAVEQECELLQMQVHQLQEELERYYIELKAAARSGGASTGAGAAAADAPARVQHARAADTVTFGRVTLFEQRVNPPPHRHLDFEFEAVRVSGLIWPHVKVRLVEHRGRPGILFFGTAGQRPLLNVWQPHGQETGQPYMLFVPEDRRAWSQLASMATGDWRVLSAIATGIQKALAEADSPASHFWRMVAARLGDQLQGLSARLRYSSLDVSRSDVGDDVLDVCFSDLLFCGRPIASLRLLWRPKGTISGPIGETPLCLLAPDDDPASPLFAGWRVNDAGEPLASMPVPVAEGLDSKGKRQRWARLSEADRDLVLAVLDALPACAASACEAGILPGTSQASLTRSAHHLHRDARRVVLGLRWRQLSASTLRRLARRK